MKKTYLKIGILIILIIAVIAVFGGLTKGTRISTVRAFGELLVDFGVPADAPIFTVVDMKPGDPPYTHNVIVNNSGSVGRVVAVKGVRTDGTTELPNLEHILDIVINCGGVDIYGGTSMGGGKTVEQFFEDSGSENGIELGIWGTGSIKSCMFSVVFPARAGNPYQGKSVVFDLTFGTIAANHIVINEVYYQVDSSHGTDNPKDRGVDEKGKKLGINHEWIELYNPTGKDISLKNWTLTDNQTTVIIHPNKIIKAGGFALISKDAAQWKYWDPPKSALKVEIGSYIGDGLDNLGDHLILKNDKGAPVDAMGYGTDQVVFNPAVPAASVGQSLERIVPGYDTDTISDWLVNTIVSPGL